MPIAYQMPPWVGQPADPAAHYQAGVQIGARLGAEQAAQQYRQQQLLLEQQKQAFEQQYAMQKQALEIGDIIQKQRATAAYQGLVSQGADPMQALAMVGPSMGVDPSRIAAIEENRIARQQEMRSLEANRQATRRLAQTREARLMGSALSRRQEAADRLAETKRYHNLMLNKPQKPTLSPVQRSILSSLTSNLNSLNSAITKAQALDPNSDVELLVKQRNNLVDQLSQFEAVAGGAQMEEPAGTSMDESEPIAETDEQGEGIGNDTMPDVAEPKPEKTQERVRMKAPNGKTGTLPADQVEAAVAKGWTKL